MVHKGNYAINDTHRLFFYNGNTDEVSLKPVYCCVEVITRAISVDS